MIPRKARKKNDDTGSRVRPGGENGIREKHDTFPLWLILVAAALIVWAIWYTIAYWSPPANRM